MVAFYRHHAIRNESNSALYLSLLRIVCVSLFNLPCSASVSQPADEQTKYCHIPQTNWLEFLRQTYRQIDERAQGTPNSNQKYVSMRHWAMSQNPHDGNDEIHTFFCFVWRTVEQTQHRRILFHLIIGLVYARASAPLSLLHIRTCIVNACSRMRPTNPNNPKFYIKFLMIFYDFSFSLCRWNIPFLMCQTFCYTKNCVIFLE